MTDTETVLAIILTSLLSIFFVLCIAVVVAVLKLIKVVKQVVLKAENVVDSVEEAAEVFKDTSGRMAFFKLIRNIIKLANKERK